MTGAGGFSLWMVWMLWGFLVCLVPEEFEVAEFFTRAFLFGEVVDVYCGEEFVERVEEEGDEHEDVGEEDQHEF